MTTVTTDTRTPLWAMTDEQLLFVAADDTNEWDRRCVATSVLADRIEVSANVDLSLQQRTTPASSWATERRWAR